MVSQALTADRANVLGFPSQENTLAAVESSFQWFNPKLSLYLRNDKLLLAIRQLGKTSTGSKTVFNTVAHVAFCRDRTVPLEHYEFVANANIRQWLNHRGLPWSQVI